MKDLKKLKWKHEKESKTKIWFQVRQALPSDARDIEILLQQLGYPPASQEAVLKILGKYSHSMSAVFVADLGERVIAFISTHVMPAFHFPSNIGMITAFCVDEGFRSHGVGKKLLQAAEDMFRLHGCDRIELNSSIKPERESAHRFYKEMGFEEKRVRYVRLLK